MKLFNIKHSIIDGIPDLKGKIVNCFLKENSDFWIGTETGLYKYNLITKKLKIYTNSPKDPGQETGLGLSISFNIISRHIG